uniref:Putative conserved secreted protein n=1 Tax=Amblyomma tuberculatum TaxID=48802 RepID=A0A6M2E6M7_9ACAR
MRALALFLLAVSLCGTAVQGAAAKKLVVFCVLPDEYRVLALQCMWRQTYREVHQLISTILLERQWNVKQFASGLCNPYEVFALRKYFKQKREKKLFGEAVTQTKACVGYIIKNYLHRAAAQE